MLKIRRWEKSTQDSTRASGTLAYAENTRPAVAWCACDALSTLYLAYPVIQSLAASVATESRMLLDYIKVNSEHSNKSGVLVEHLAKMLVE